MFSLTVISSPLFFEGESTLVTELFESGLETYHLRKKSTSEMEVESFLDKVPGKYHQHIVLHSHQHLNGSYFFKGVHGQYPGRADQTFSVSIHSFEEYFHTGNEVDYVFLSPVFSSISKPGYQPGFHFYEYPYFFDKKSFHPYPPKVIALGGVDKTNIREAVDLGFDGAALLGSIWNEPSQAVKNFLEIQQLC